MAQRSWDIEGKTIGTHGAGRIGREVMKRLQVCAGGCVCFWGGGEVLVPDTGGKQVPVVVLLGLLAPEGVRVGRSTPGTLRARPLAHMALAASVGAEAHAGVLLTQPGCSTLGRGLCAQHGGLMSMHIVLNSSVGSLQDGSVPGTHVASCMFRLNQLALANSMQVKY